MAELAAAGVAMIAHLGLRPQSIGMMGGYRFQGRTAQEAVEIVSLGDADGNRPGRPEYFWKRCLRKLSAAVVAETSIPVIGCGASHPCHGSVIVTQDGLGLTDRPPRFVPMLGDLAEPMERAFAEYVSLISSGHIHQPNSVMRCRRRNGQNFCDGGRRAAVVVCKMINSESQQK